MKNILFACVRRPTWDPSHVEGVTKDVIAPMLKTNDVTTETEAQRLRVKDLVEFL